ncbi:MAG: Uncharacterized protein FD147_1264 [Chloroflexi bacterium]|nr:MAG: Uncharacterized protein FD147_1264 [Chloroflexota bacterium]MBA4375520.1 hypothetical protein [Anaerolinea sp.]
MPENSNWKTIAYIIGGTAGLLTGLAAAFLLIRKREQNLGNHKLTSGEGVKIGLGVVSLLRMISESGTR